RTPTRAALRGLRVACRPPPHAARPPCAAPEPPCPLTCQRNADNTFKEHVKEVQCPVSPHAQCGDSMDRVAQRISAARLARRQEYEREVAARAAQHPAAPVTPPAPLARSLAAGREVVRATDGRDYVVLPPLAHSQQKSDHGEKDSTVELDPAKGCVINPSSHVDPCAHRPRILLEIDRSEVSKTARSPLTASKSPLVSAPSSAQNQNNENEVENSKKCCKGSALGPMTDWCSSRPKIKPQRPDCVQPSLVERIKRRSLNSSNEVRKFHTASSLLSQNLTPTEQNEIGDVTAKVKADAHKLNKMLDDRDKLKEAGRGRNTIRDKTEEASASGQLELRAPASGVGVRVRVSLLGGTPPARPCARPSRPSDSADGAPQDPSTTYYGKCDSWLSIKNIQKKLTGCRNDDKSGSQNPSSKEVNLGSGSSPCSLKQSQKRSPCDQKRQHKSDSPCQAKQKPKPPPCCGAPPTSRCSAPNMQILPDTTLIL
ncbi:PREDICTED: uncharacterized protein LOC106113078, partial [Papilio xuthus]|uniref:Uncharacterized protein LOC106113078 n=1 Tax=Papilio xuthus TaxID=66420 RepID=A0AAJ6YYF7_PAPXU